MLDDKHLELLIDAADHEWIAAKYRVEMGVDRAMHGDECEEKALKLIRAARADLAAMRAPITTEELRAAGWEQQSDMPSHWSSPYSPQHTFVALKTDGCAFVRRGVILCRLSNMHDLRELVRLLGGIA